MDAARIAAGPERGVLCQARSERRRSCRQPGGGGRGPGTGRPEWEAAQRTAGPGEDPTGGADCGVSRQSLDMCCCVVVQRLIEEENMLAPSLQQFSLRTEMLPSYIPVRVAEKILFVGESVQMFENHTHGPSRAGNLVWH